MLTRLIGEAAVGAQVVLDVVRELVAEVLEHALHRHRRGIAERADGAALDVVGHRVEQRQVGNVGENPV